MKRCSVTGIDTNKKDQKSVKDESNIIYWQSFRGKVPTYNWPRNVQFIVGIEYWQCTNLITSNGLSISFIQQ